MSDIMSDIMSDKLIISSFFLSFLDQNTSFDKKFKVSKYYFFINSGDSCLYSLLVIVPILLIYSTALFCLSFKSYFFPIPSIHRKYNFQDTPRIFYLKRLPILYYHPSFIFFTTAPLHHLLRLHNSFLTSPGVMPFFAIRTITK